MVAWPIAEDVLLLLLVTIAMMDGCCKTDGVKI